MIIVLYIYDQINNDFILKFGQITFENKVNFHTLICSIYISSHTMK
jgi:hypothetical protein